MRTWLCWLVLLFCTAIPLAARADEPAAPTEAHQQLRQILERPLYQRWRLRQERDDVKVNSELLKSIGESIGRAVDWLADKIGRWWPSGNSSQSSGWFSGIGGIVPVLKVVAWMALAVVLVVIGVWLYRAIRGIEPRARSAQVLSREQVRKALDAGEAMALDTPEWLREAERLAREKDPRAVYRALYLALLSGLHTAGKIDFRLTRTNWIYVRHFRGPTEQRSTFSSLTEMFDLVWYGHRSADMNRIEELRRSVTDLIQGGA